MISTGNKEIPKPRRYAEDETTFTEKAGAKPKNAHQKKGSRVKRIVIISIIGILVLCLGFVSWYAYRIYAGLNSLERSSELLPESNIVETAPSKPVVFMLLGSDTRDPQKERGRSDVIILGYLPANHEHFYLISFTRDLYVPIPGHGKNKINAAYSFGGPKLTAQTLQNLTGVKINHAAIIDFEGFMELTTIVGGIEVENNQPGCQFEDCFEAGRIHLEGRKALNYVRQRHRLAGGDLDRSERHREVIKALIQKLMSKNILTDQAVFNDFLAQLSKTITISDSLTNTKILSLAKSIKFNSSNDIRSIQVHIDRFETINGGAMDILDEKAMQDLAWALQNDRMENYYQAYKDQPRIGGAPVKMSRSLTDSTPTANPSAAPTPQKR